MEKKRLFIAGAAALVVFGVFVAAAAAYEGGQRLMGKPWMKGGFGRQAVFGNLSFLEDMGLPDNATREEVQEALWQRHLKDLGLTEDSTLREYRLAVKAKGQSMQAEQGKQLRTRLGLAVDASDDDVRGAMQNMRTEGNWTTHKGCAGKGPQHGGFKGIGRW
ncbi:MAG: hypothetical protein V1875_09655 [Candidatus Altiarchaeota archaeon]